MTKTKVQKPSSWSLNLPSKASRANSQFLPVASLPVPGIIGEQQQESLPEYKTTSPDWVKNHSLIKGLSTLTPNSAVQPTLKENPNSSQETIDIEQNSQPIKIQKLCSTCQQEKEEKILQPQPLTQANVPLESETQTENQQAEQPKQTENNQELNLENAPKTRENKSLNSNNPPETVNNNLAKIKAEKEQNQPEKAPENSDKKRESDSSKSQEDSPSNANQSSPNTSENKTPSPEKREKDKPLETKETVKSEQKQEPSKTLEEIPQAQTLKEAMASEKTSNLKPENNGKANLKTEAEKEQSLTVASQTQAEQNTLKAQTQQLASTGINFALPKQSQMQGGENTATPEQQRAMANNLASNFFAQATTRLQQITELGQEIPARLQGITESAKASVLGTVEQQKATVNAQIAQQRNQAQNQAQTSIAQIQAQYQTVSTAIAQQTATNRQQISTKHTTALQTVDQKQNSQLTRLERLYGNAAEQYRNKGTQVGDEAIAIGEEKATAWESQIKGQDDNFWDGPLSDNRLKARAKAAREVAKQYKDGLIEEANKQADQISQGKDKDIQAIRDMAQQSRQSLQQLQQQSLENLNASQQQGLAQIGQAKTQLIQTINQTLQATLQTLAQQQVAQVQFLNDYGQRQILAIERDAQKAIASLQDGVNQAGTKLQQALQDASNQLQGIEAPNPEELGGVFTEILGQFDQAMATVQGQTEQGITASQHGITGGGQQAVGAVNAIAQSGLSESTAISEGATTTLTQLNQGARESFNQIQQTYSTTVNQTKETALQGFNQVTEGIQTAFDQANQNLETGFQESANNLEQGLRGALRGNQESNLVDDIKTYADQAADQEQPRWKTVLKVVLVIAVIVVAIVVAPAVIGAVGALAGALGASAAAASAIGAVVGGAIVGAASGAVIQMGNNAIDGKPIMEGVGKAAIVGAIGGALGGAGGVLGNVLGQAGRLGTGLTQSVLKFGIDAAFDIAGGIFGDLSVGNPITLEGVLIGAGIGAAVQISTANLGKLGRLGRNIEGMQTRTFQAGERLGGRLGDRIRSPFGGGRAETTAGSSSNVDLPGNRLDVETESPKGLTQDSELPMTPREQEVLENTANKRGNELTPEELDTELALAGKGESKPIDEGEFVEEIKLPNDHEWKQKQDGTWCRFSGQGDCLPPGKRPQRQAAEQANKKIKTSSGTGEALAKSKGYGDAPEGYNWTNQNGEPVLRRNPDKANELLELKPDPKNPEQFIPVVSPPKDYKWVSQSNNKFTLEPQADNLPPIEFDPARNAFIDKNTQNIYVPPSASGNSDWGRHQWGNPSVDPCFPPGTIVKTPKGDRKIEELRVGDLVIAYDFEANTLVAQPILHLYKNTTQQLVDISVGDELITSTRLHQFWVENSKEWLPACTLETGMNLRSVGENSIPVDFAKTYDAQSTTYNLEVSQVHNYFVGTLGILVHNGGDDKASNFEDTTKKSAKIYEIVDLSPGKEVIIYRGKTTQDSVNDRFKQHLNDDATKKLNWMEKYKQGELTIREIARGDWTDYETAVWEKHFIDEALSKNYPLVNDLRAHPISQEKYQQYKHLHSPC
ncbi:AAA ATPase containing von Willebrand factor type A (vWA) domain [Gloeothece citriformis PCC 7424]|uniref:AAA ATPase containing von Willebrand factor type A (VWA) domain n=1 Tax=Gloeothece citriformis (strain PCC 7424) TaxID=65393 RepID=B7KLF0_GLOC7|nr:polymorphic toxin-type HINT domain-containing protein [Gloeothece citriformis]ACK72522.1 AAA ATPase containing von Willebrand factor type A (vWA) domain [Gloeothece citriformis PCC 7424]